MVGGEGGGGSWRGGEGDWEIMVNITSTAKFAIAGGSTAKFAIGRYDEYHIDREIRDCGRIDRKIRNREIMVNITSTAKIAIAGESTAKFAIGRL